MRIRTKQRVKDIDFCKIMDVCLSDLKIFYDSQAMSKVTILVRFNFFFFLILLF